MEQHVINESFGNGQESQNRVFQKSNMDSSSLDHAIISASCFWQSSKGFELSELPIFWHQMEMECAGTGWREERDGSLDGCN